MSAKTFNNVTLNVAFTVATTRANIASDEKLSVSLGKIAKWYDDLHAVAWSGSYSDLSNKPTSLKNPNSLTVKGNGTASFTYDGSAAKTLNVKPGTGISVSSDTSGNITIGNNAITSVKGTTGTGNAITNIEADTSGKLTLTKGKTFSEDGHDHLYEDIKPIMSKTFTDIIATANNTDNAAFYFGSLKPDSWNDLCHIRFRVKVYVPTNANYWQYAEVNYYTIMSTAAYNCENLIYKTTYRAAYYHYLYKLTQTGFNSGYGHLIGESLYNSANPTSADYKRTFEVEILEVNGGTFEFFDNVTLYKNAPGTGSTNYTRASAYSFTTNGLFPDNDTTNMLRYAARTYTGNNGIRANSLVFRNPDDRYDSLTVTNGNGTSKVWYTDAKISYPPKVLYCASGSTVAANTLFGASTSFVSYPDIDMRYSDNITSSVGYTINKSLYLECDWNEDGYFTIGESPYKQTFTAGKYYIFLGWAVYTSVHQLTLHVDHPVFYYDGEKLIPFEEHRYALKSHNHDSTYLKLSGGTVNGKITAKTFSGSGESLTSLNASNISSGTLSVDRLANSGATAGSYGPSANVSPSHGGTFNVPYLTVNAKGQVTAVSSKTITLPASGNTDAKVLQANSTTSSFRPILLGYSNATDPTTFEDCTNQSYYNAKLYAQPSTGALYSASNFYSGGGGLYSLTNGVPTGSSMIPVILHNGTNLWIGSENGTSPAVTGQVYISTGYDAENSKGNETIKIAIPKDDNSGILESYAMLHSNNWSNYITISSLGAASSSHNHDSAYLKLSGGTISSGSFGPLVIKRNTEDNAAITFENSAGTLGAIAINEVDGSFKRFDSTKASAFVMLDAANYKDYCTPTNIGAATSSHTHNYAGSSSAGGAATTAVALTTSDGTATKPVYFSNGKPVACTYTLGKSVPSDAVFTDTHYTTHLIAGASATATANAAATNGKVYLNLLDNTTIRESHNIVGSGATTVTCDANGKITIDTASSSYTHPTYTAVTGKPTANQTPGFGQTFTISQITTDSLGHVTGATDRTVKIPNATMGAASASAAGSSGLVPAPAKGKQGYFLRGDGTWQLPSVNNMTGATSSAAGTAGLVPAPAAGKNFSFLRGDGKWASQEYSVNFQARSGSAKAYLTTTNYTPSSTQNQTSLTGESSVYISGTGDTLSLHAPIFAGSGESLTSINATNISSGTLSVNRLGNSGATAGSYGQTADATLAASGSFVIPSITVDAKGRVTAASDKTVTLPPDQYVKQSNTTTTNFRPILLSANYGTDPSALTETTTAQAYITSSLYVQPSTGDIYSTKGGIYSSTNGVPTGRTSIPMIYHNGSNMWIGAASGSTPQFNGVLYISSGYNTSSSKGNDSIYISIPKDDNSGAKGNYKVLHSNNYKNYCTPANIGAEPASTLIYSGMGSNSVTVTEDLTHFKTITIQMQHGSGSVHVIEAITTDNSWCPVVFDPPRSATQQYVRFSTAKVTISGTTLTVASTKIAQINIATGAVSIGDEQTFSILNVWGHK